MFVDGESVHDEDEWHIAMHRHMDLPENLPDPPNHQFLREPSVFLMVVWYFASEVSETDRVVGLSNDCEG